MLDVKFSSFTDWPGLKARFQLATRNVVTKAAAFVWKDAKTSIKPRKKPAAAGQAPSSHTGRLRNLIFFAFDPYTISAVIGPLLFRKRTPTVPLLLEKGGDVTTTEQRIINSVEHAGMKITLPAGSHLKYQAHPYMGPALDAERDHFPQLFSDSVK